MRSVPWFAEGSIEFLKVFLESSPQTKPDSEGFTYAGWTTTCWIK